MKARNVTQHSWESEPILNGEQPEAIENSEVALNDHGCTANAHPTTALSDFDPGLLNYRDLFWLLHTRWPRQRGTYRLLDETYLDEDSSENQFSETCHF